MEETPGSGPTSLIVVAVEKGKEEEAAGRLSEELSIEADVARQIVGGTPIVFIGGLTKTEVRTLTPRLQKLSEAGLEFRLTQKAPNNLPRLNWPIRPNFAGGGSGPEGVSFQWKNNAFVCPGCGESFLFRRMGSVPLTTDAAPAQESHSAAPPKRDSAMPKQLTGGGVTDRMKSREPGKGSNPKLEAVKEPAPAAESLDDMLGDAGGGLDLDAALGSTPEAEAAPADLGLSDELGGGELISSMEGLDAGGGLDAHVDDGEEKFNVFISGIKEDAKRDEAAKIIAEVRGMPLAEAKKLTSRAMIKAADAIGKTKAEELVNKLKKLKLSARMTKVAGA